MTTTRTVRIILGDAELETKEVALHEAVTAEVIAEAEFTDKEAAYKLAKEKKAGASSLVRQLTREVYQRETHGDVTCSWRYCEESRDMRLYRDDTGEMVPGESRAATAQEKTLTLDLEPQAPLIRVLPQLPAGVVPTAKDKVRKFMGASAGGFTLDGIQQHTGVNKNTLRRVLPELCAEGVITRNDDGTYDPITADDRKAAE